MSAPYKKAIMYLFCKVPTLIMIQFDELASYHPQHIVSVCSIDQAFQMRVLIR